MVASKKSEQAMRELSSQSAAGERFVVDNCGHSAHAVLQGRSIDAR